MKYCYSLLLWLTAFSFSSPLNAQITLEQSYIGGRLNLYMVNLENSGMKYVLKSAVAGNRFIKLYNLDHSLWKTIDCNAFPQMINCGPGNSTQVNFSSLYISETLFNCDSAVEFMYVNTADCRWFTGIYSETGAVLIEVDSAAPLVPVTIPQHQRPIYNTPEGTKMILSHLNGSGLVYNLPCKLSTDIDNLTMKTDEAMLNAMPNPGFYQQTITYKLPSAINRAEIVITDVEGREVKRYQVDDSFSSLLVNHSDIATGTYFYSLISNGSVLDTKKILLAE